jgi:hypothetical protein
MMEQIQPIKSSEKQILTLPDEILVLIFANIQSRNGLLSLMCACRRFCRIAEAELYKSILIRDIQDSKALFGSLSWYPERALHVQDFSLHFGNQKSLSS